MSARKNAKELIKESKRLARKSSTLSDERRAELKAAQAAVADALEADSGLEEAVVALEEKVDAWLSHLRKSRFREYVESIGVAVLFALTVRAFGFEAFQIPSPSMLPTLLVGDHLFVAKTSYGLRIPFTTNYLARWGTVQRGDVIVFEFPSTEVATQQTIQSIDIQVQRYADRFGGYPATLDDAGVSAAARFDAWDRALQYGPVAESYRLVSAGADGEFGTDDDLTNENRARLAPGCVDQASVDHTKDYIKRVIGVAGDRVRLEGTRYSSTTSRSRGRTSVWTLRVVSSRQLSSLATTSTRFAIGATIPTLLRLRSGKGMSSLWETTATIPPMDAAGAKCQSATSKGARCSSSSRGIVPVTAPSDGPASSTQWIDEYSFAGGTCRRHVVRRSIVRGQRDRHRRGRLQYLDVWLPGDSH